MLSTVTSFIFYHTPIFYLIQSIWRDEAFSYFMAKPNIGKVIINTANDFNPPLYYLLLHFWMNIFGRSDESLRLLSFLPHIASVYIAYQLVSKISTKRLALFAAIFTFFNPMLLYYAFEIRMYSLYALFAFCSLYFFTVKNWKWYTISCLLGLYTHSFFSLVLVSYCVYLLHSHQFKKKNVFRILKPFLFYLPWLPVLMIQFLRSKDSWMFPVDLQLVKSVLGNLFTNYEGTPGGWWHWTFLLSAVIFLSLILAARKKKKEAFLFIIPILVPLVLILGFSVLRRPIYVNRYMIFITIFEIMGILLFISSIKNKAVRSATAFFWLIFVIIFNIVIGPYHKKTDFKTTFMEINKKASQNDFVYTKTPISFLESAYYYKFPSRVFVFNPKNITIPNYIGTNAVFPNASKTSLPPSPSRVFFIADDASYEVIINK